jgi:hypothetical protein
MSDEIEKQDDIPVFEGEVIQGPVTAKLHGADVILCNRTECLFNIPYEIDDGTNPDVCCRPEVEWDSDRGCINFAEYSDKTELGEGQVVSRQEVEPWLTESGRPECVHIHEGMMYFINKTPVPKEAFDKAVQTAIDYNARMMAEAMSNRGPLPEDMDKGWIHDYRMNGDSAISRGHDDRILEREGRRKLMEGNSKKQVKLGD